MHYLIDGHNLIAKMSSISLDDPNDEMKLILQLKSWAAADRRRRVTVIFDGGMPGGKSLRISNDSVRVVFASTGKSADALLIKRIRRAKNPPEHTLVTSDQQIIAVAESRRMPYYRSEAFAANLPEEKQVEAPTSTEQTPDTADEPQISADELAEWLELFGPEPASRPSPKKPVPKPSRPKPMKPKTEKKELSDKEFTIAKRSEHGLDDEEVEAWLELFNSDED